MGRRCHRRRIALCLRQPQVDQTQPHIDYSVVRLPRKRIHFPPRWPPTATASPGASLPNGVAQCARCQSLPATAPSHRRSRLLDALAPSLPDLAIWELRHRAVDTLLPAAALRECVPAVVTSAMPENRLISPNIDMESRFTYPQFLSDHGVRAIAQWSSSVARISARSAYCRSTAASLASSPTMTSTSFVTTPTRLRPLYVDGTSEQAQAVAGCMLGRARQGIGSTSIGQAAESDQLRVRVTTSSQLCLAAAIAFCSGS